MLPCASCKQLFVGYAGSVVTSEYFGGLVDTKNDQYYRMYRNLPILPNARYSALVVFEF